MDVVKLLAERLVQTQLTTTNYNNNNNTTTTVTTMRAPLLDDNQHDSDQQFDERDSGTASDEDISSTTTQLACTDLHSSTTPGLAPSTQTMMTSYYRVTSSRQQQQLTCPSVVNLTSLSFMNPASMSGQSAVSFRPVAGVRHCELDCWWNRGSRSAFTMPPGGSSTGSPSSLCSDDLSNCSSDRNVSEDDEADMVTMTTTMRVVRKRHRGDSGCSCSSASDATDLDQEIQNILDGGGSSEQTSSSVTQLRVRQHQSTSCRLCQGSSESAASQSNDSTQQQQQQHKRQRHSMSAEVRRPSLNLYKMQKLRIGRKSHCRKMSLLQHNSVNRPRPLALSGQSPCLSKCLSPSPGGVRVPAYCFRSLSYIRSAVRRHMSPV